MTFLFYLIISYILSYLISLNLNKVKFFIPLNIIAGFLFLLFKLAKCYESSTLFKLFPSILLGGLFSAFILQSNQLKTLKIQNDDVKFLIYTYLQFILQWTLGPLLVWLLLNKSDLLLLTLPVSFAGGHGSVIFISNMVNNPYLDLMLMSATVGVLFSVIGGTYLSRKFWVRNKSELPSFNKNSLLVLILIMVSSYYLNIYLSSKIPIFIFSVGISIVLRLFFKSKINYSSSSQLLIDLLVMSSIASINFFNVYTNIKLLLAIWALGLLLAIINYKFIAPKLIDKQLFETSLFTWGWSLGGIGIGLALVKNCDHNMSENVFNKYAKVYPYIAILEISLLVLIPNILNN